MEPIRSDGPKLKGIRQTKFYREFIVAIMDAEGEWVEAELEEGATHTNLLIEAGRQFVEITTRSGVVYGRLRSGPS